MKNIFGWETDYDIIHFGVSSHVLLKIKLHYNNYSTFIPVVTLLTMIVT